MSSLAFITILAVHFYRCNAEYCVQYRVKFMSQLSELPLFAGFSVKPTAKEKSKYSEYEKVTQRAKEITTLKEWQESEFQDLQFLLYYAMGSGVNDFPKGDQGKPVQQTGYGIAFIPSSGLLLTKPGRYVLQTNVVWDPAADNSAAITIAGDYIHLDFAGFTIQKSQESTRKHTVGILVLPHATVRLTNGTLHGFDLHGICALGVTDLQMHAMTVTRFTGEIHIFLVGCKYALVKSCTVTSSTVRSATYSGLQLRFCQHVSIVHLRASNLRNEAGGCCGISVVFSNDIVIRRSKCSNLSTGDDHTKGSPGQTCLGIFMLLSANVYISDCICDGIAGSFDDAHGISVFFCLANIYIDKCSVSRVSTGFGSDKYKSGAKCTGVELMFVHNVQVKDTTVKQVTALNPQDRQAAGFTTAGTTDVVFRHCVAETISCTGPGAGVAFGWAPDPRPLFVAPSDHTSYEACDAYDADVGFDLFYQNNATITRCSTHDVRLQVVDNVSETRTVSCNEATECATPMTVIIPNKGSYNNVVQDVSSFRSSS